MAMLVTRTLPALAVLRTPVRQLARQSSQNNLPPEAEEHLKKALRALMPPVGLTRLGFFRAQFLKFQLRAIRGAWPDFTVDDFLEGTKAAFKSVAEANADVSLLLLLLLLLLESKGLCCVHLLNDIVGLWR